MKWILTYDKYIIGCLDEYLEEEMKQVGGIKFADKMEDLCDAFILYDTDLNKFDLIEKDRINPDWPNKIIYGAVWTLGKRGEPNLTPVIQMCKDGTFGFVYNGLEPNCYNELKGNETK